LPDTYYSGSSGSQPGYTSGGIDYTGGYDSSNYYDVPDYTNNDSSSYYRDGGMATPMMAGGGEVQQPSYYTYGTAVDPRQIMQQMAQNNYTDTEFANGGYAAKGKRPSREEMSKVERLSAKDIAKAKEVPSFKSKEEALEADPWSTEPIYGDVTQPAAITAAEAIANVQDILGGTNSEGCVHGDMTWKEGEKAGRAWGGFFCGYAPRTGEAKCSTVWYNLGSNGKWERQKLRSV
jgi:hypothetical protein